MSIIWTIIIGFLAGVLAKFFMPGKNEPSGFIMTTILGIVGAFVASYLGQALGFYGPGEGAGLIGAVVGAVVVLFVGDESALPPDLLIRTGTDAGASCSSSRPDSPRHRQSCNPSARCSEIRHRAIAGMDAHAATQRFDARMAIPRP